MFQRQLWAKVIGRFVVLLALVAVINWLIRSAALSSTWGNPIIDNKIAYLLENGGDFDAVFIGASTTKWQVSPLDVESHLGPSHAFRLYNLGEDGVMLPESIVVFERVLQEKPETLRYIFMELMVGYPERWQGFLHTSRFNYWHNAAITGMQGRLILRSDYQFSAKVRLVAQEIMGYVERELNIGMGTDMIHRWLNRGAYASMAHVVGSDGHGYVALMPGTGWEDGRERLLEDPTKLTQISDSIVRQIGQNGNLLNSVYGDRLHLMLAMAAKANVKLIFVMPPRYFNTLVYSIPGKYRIELTDPRAYPELYTLENSWDELHLNAQGSKLYSALLAHKIDALLNAP